MASILILLPQIIAIIPTIGRGVETIIALIGSIRSAAKQTGEWTPELETAFLESLLATNTNPVYKQD